MKKWLVVLCLFSILISSLPVQAAGFHNNIPPAPKANYYNNVMPHDNFRHYSNRNNFTPRPPRYHNDRTTKKVVTGTLLGALVGGLITYTITR